MNQRCQESLLLAVLKGKPTGGNKPNVRKHLRIETPGVQIILVVADIPVCTYKADRNPLLLTVRKGFLTAQKTALK
jgi:hypothetical protein